MAELTGRRIVVAGAGAVGSTAGLALQRAGAEVLLADPAPFGLNASGVAAGMLAPAMEAALDPLSHGHFGLLRRGRDAWLQLAPGVGAEVHRCGALWFGDEAVRPRVAERLARMGAGWREASKHEAETMAPGLRAPTAAFHTDEDWRLDPRPALQALARAFEAAGGRRAAAAVTGFADGAARLSGGTAVKADAVVLATGGAAPGFADAPLELARLTPIKGQIARFEGAEPRTGPVVRHAGGYIVPGEGGPFAGATMEEGRADATVDLAMVEALADSAAAFFPRLARIEFTAAAGVRYGLADGLPLVGASATPGVFLAVGARRNGWLLAPLMAEALVAAITGDEGGAFAPRRFVSSA
jgi:glycine oxidase